VSRLTKAPRLAAALPLCVALVLGGCGPLAAAPPPEAPTPAPPRDVAAGESVTRFEGDRLEMAFYAPESLALQDGRFDLVVHFHGKHETAIEAVDEAGLPAALVNVDLGVGSAVYRESYAAEDSLERVIAFAENELAASGRLPDARAGRVAISAFSAGFAAAREILKRPADVDRVDAVLLVDGFFADWENKRRRTVALDMIQDTVAFARRASRGEKLFVLTHTAIDRKTYAGAPDCARALLDRLELERGPPHVVTASGGSPSYAVDVGGLHVWGFDGKSWVDHVAQHRSMGALHYATLRDRWAVTD